MPMAMSTKKAENPVTPILPTVGSVRPPRTRRRVLFREREVGGHEEHGDPAPRQVAMPAPRMPRSATNTR